MSDRDKRQGTRRRRAKKGLLEVMTGRTWLDLGLSHKARNTRECVLLRFWLDCVADRFGRREAITPNTLAGMKKNGWGRNLRRAC